jgi:hypothetical protein
MISTESPLFWIVIPLMIGGLVAFVPAWLMIQKAFFTSRWRVATVFMCPLIACALAAPAFYIPFLLLKGQEVGPYDTLNDLLLLGAVPLAILALVAYVADHFSESPLRCLISSAACVAIAALPILYFFWAEQLHQDLGIRVADDIQAVSEPEVLIDSTRP